jgi:uncharacterized protein
VPRPPLRLLVSDLLREPGRRREVVLEAPVDWALELSRVEPSVPLRARLTLEGTSGGIVARGRVTVTVRHTCRRCLTEWTEPLEVNLLEVLAADPEAEYRLHGDEADLEPPLRDAVLLALPLRPDCRPDCRGLCAVCGGDLNTGSCPGHDEAPGSPFAPLRDLLRP